MTNGSMQTRNINIMRVYHITPTSFPKPTEVGMAEIYSLIEKHGGSYDLTHINDSKRTTIPVRLPEGWSINVCDTGYRKCYYILDSSRKGVAMIRLIREDICYMVQGHLLHESWEPFHRTYPYPSFYSINDEGYLTIDTKTTIGKLITIANELEDNYREYLKGERSHENLENLFIEAKKLMEEVPEWESYVELNYAKKILKRPTLPLKAEDMRAYLVNEYTSIDRSGNIKDEIIRYKSFYWDVYDFRKFVFTSYDFPFPDALEYSQFRVNLHDLPELHSELFRLI